ncbi:hypothetical protein EJ02DRAFT_433108 [Clathrospora elynae]|uniref:Geranylgeranyl pyrophosphate synthetase n=1 Tax=Clathrospora elynae TaxID=706981 RepID=A0A6A5SW62_9PLEO|nr:hypothetical protein EJ02DRAFT_433108 [Clathrospora elynae]
MSFTSSYPGSSRGGYARRRGRDGLARPFAQGREQVKPDIEKHTLGHLLKTFRSADLNAERDDLAHGTTISDCQYIASYNWSNEKTRTIIVPGKPPQWTPLHISQRLEEDSGQYFRDPNAAKYPDHPMAPVVHAILDIDPDFYTTRVDLFACGSTLGNLLRFTRGMDKAFRFNIEMVGNTVFFVRKENDPKELIQNVRGFGHTFPEAYTTWESDVKGSDTHQRIVQYEFGGLKCLVRFESDGYIRDASMSRDSSSDSTAGDEDDLLGALQSATITRPTDRSSRKSDTLKIKHGGSVVPQHTIFDLKTRSGKYKKDIDMNDIYPQLWIKQIPNFIVAYHDGAGLFQDIRVQDVKKDVQRWEKDNKDGIRRLAVLLKNILDIAKNDERGLLEVYCPGADCLEIRSQYGEGAHALPTELSDKWAENELDPDSTHAGASDWDDHASGNVYDSDSGFGYDFDKELDYTACSVEDCGYCGRCTY